MGIVGPIAQVLSSGVGIGVSMESAGAECAKCGHDAASHRRLVSLRDSDFEGRTSRGTVNYCSGCLRDVSTPYRPRHRYVSS